MTEVDVVAIGASAGGVAALPVVLSMLATDFGPAVLVVQHLDPHARSYLASVLGRHCRLPVKEAANGDVLQHGVVYVAPPGAHLEVHGDTLALSDTPPVHFCRPSVDVLFRSVARARGVRAVGVILTGAGVDGAAGLRAIKDAGGRTIVEDPLTAEHSGMPGAAHATGRADMTLPLAEIGAAINEFVPVPRG
jgi:two-component system chemotaxis response regulator CheB